MQSPSETVLLQDGSRVRIDGLQAKPELNGRTGVVYGAFNQESGRWAIHIDANDASPATQISVRPANLKILPGISTSPRHTAPRASDSDAVEGVAGQIHQLSTCASTVSVAESDQSLTSLAAPEAPPPPCAAVVQDGSRVRIEGLQAKPELNGRTGVVYGAFNQESGRWAIHVDADGASPACQAAIRPSNLKLIPCRNFSTEWEDEEGRVWPKNVDFSRECAKGHALAPLGDCCGDGGGVRLMCRLCHSFCARDSDAAASWLTCSVDAGCCGGYAVCCSCASAPSSAAVVCAGSDDLCTLVSCIFDCCMMKLLT